MREVHKDCVEIETKKIKAIEALEMISTQLDEEKETLRLLEGNIER